MTFTSVHPVQLYATMTDITQPLGSIFNLLKPIHAQGYKMTKALPC